MVSGSCVGNRDTHRLSGLLLVLTPPQQGGQGGQAGGGQQGGQGGGQPSGQAGAQPSSP